jgi:hypothetical protein
MSSLAELEALGLAIFENRISAVGIRQLEVFYADLNLLEL